jgi:hypothetical protein
MEPPIESNLKSGICKLLNQQTKDSNTTNTNDKTNTKTTERNSKHLQMVKNKPPDPTITLNDTF